MSRNRDEIKLIMPKTNKNRRKDMLIGERRIRIIDLLQEKGIIVVSELSGLLSVTEETIRRDLEGLEKEGLLKRTYGGAIAANRMDLEISFKEKEREYKKEKEAIGRTAATLIEDKDNLMVDASSTALQVIKNIRTKKELTVVTCSLAVVLELARKSEVTIISTGGIFHPESFSYVGSLAEQAARNYNVDKLFLGVKGVTSAGLADTYEAEVELKKIMIESAKEIILLVDSSKFDKTALVSIVPLEVINKVITDKGIPSEYKKLLSDRGIEVIIAS